MSELLPTLQAADVRQGLLDYLVTTFALADLEAGDALQEFLGHPDAGIFKGPYVRLRLPFRAAEEGWQSSLDWRGIIIPYGHQADAFARLSSANLDSEKTRPLPTLVTTGTGSGKTEAFLYPILDHVLRAKRAGEGGIKALILYPMNALANDQARRLADIISTTPELGGVRAALYTGQGGTKRSTMSADGLITERGAIRADPPDILLTNYKMLDQLLLRTADQTLWKASATSLRYLVLDEFHTYDGAQGTDVSMLLRRLGLALKRNWPDSHPLVDEAARARPLGLMTPVATSATMGDRGDPGAMMSFAQTVFGEPFDDGSVVTETRVALDDWSAPGVAKVAELGLKSREITNALVEGVADAALAAAREGDDAHGLMARVFGELYDGWSEETRALVGSGGDRDVLLALEQAHPFVHKLATEGAAAASIVQLADLLLPAGLSATDTYQERAQRRVTFMTAILGALSHIRYLCGRPALSADVHLWMRALTRIDRLADQSVRFTWADDGLLEVPETDDPFGVNGRPQFPAIYCRHCGRSGWGVQLAPTGTELATDDTDIRRDHASGEGRFRALLFAPAEAALDLDPARTEPVQGLHWFAARQRNVSITRPKADDADLSGGWTLPVLTLSGDTADDDSRDDTCPSCGRVDGIRFLGSAVATMLSVAVTTIFGDHSLDGAEKKALVFTDSVQDAAHRAGFVQSRSHVFSLRNAIRSAIGEYPIALDALVDELLKRAGDDRFDRYRLLGPDVSEHDNFRAFWESPTARAIPAPVMRRVRKRLLLDVELEFGLQSRVGRTLEMTGSVAAEVDAGTPGKLETIGRTALTGFTREAQLDEIEPTELFSDTVVRWVRGVLERMRDRGAIEHEWFRKYIENDGNRYFVWGGRPRGEGMPAFPKGRDAPGYPRVGAAQAGKQKTQLDVVGSSQSWFASWARKVLRVTPSDGARLTRKLLEELQKEGVLSSTAIGATGAVAYQLSPSIITVSPVKDDDLLAGAHLLVCDVCKNPITGSVQVISQLADGPCGSARCPGTVRRTKDTANYYRRLYNEGDMRRVVAREHTSLLEDKVRLAFEDGFKASIEEPDAPNVLVATPTLEMGIDIGDLSTVMLAGLPRSVASYLQRVGRAGRLTGNSLSLAFVTGRGDQLPKLGEPLSVINGEVRPPATYLNAEEILQRQYFAYLIDRRAAALVSPPREARDVLKSAETSSFLGDTVADAEANPTERLTEFLGTFDQLAPGSVDTLTSWASPGDGPATSGLAAAAFRAVKKWSDEIALLKYRREAIEKSLDELKAAAERTAATDDDRAEYRSAIASNNLIKRLLKELRTESWVGALERFGVLPNYTLLDDSVRLDVSLSWIDPDSGDFQNEALSYERGAGIAISELAPGAVFYAQGAEIAIDAVDLGIAAEAVRSWVFCASCGFGQDLALAAVPAACPRCGGKAIADAAQRLNVVELEHVSAEIRRDESSINDRRDERERVRFTVFPVADIDPAGVVGQWYAEGTGFGVKYCRDLTIRWLNIGRSGGYGQPRFFSGQERATPLFRVCNECGKLDTSSNANSRREHRPWCRHRAAKSENVVPIALSRSLTTQGVVLRLPPQLTIGDSLAAPSLSAAILLGLREVLGGDPDHLNIISTVDPVNSDGGENIDSLLIHDSVPGGTGYLAELADHEKIRDLLTRAWVIVRDCACKDEGRAACHRCVLPFAPGGQVDYVSRASAERSLGRLLGVTKAGDARPWTVVTEDPGSVDSESILEAKFREVFIARAKALGATVKEIPGDHGNKVQVTIPSTRRTWMLRPQVSLGSTTPDFVLEQHGGGIAPIAIYTDGRTFHASVLHNRIADDAAKRRGARDMGYHVLAVTWPDVERAAESAPDPSHPWFDKQLAGAFTAQFKISLSSLDHVTDNPITQLMEWMQDPEGAAARWTAIARALPVLTLKPTSTFVGLDGDSAEKAAARSLTEGTLPTSTQSAAWQLVHGRLVMLSSHASATGTTDCVLLLDDRAEAVAAQDFDDDWRMWLTLSNLLMAEARVFALSEVAGSSTPVEVGAPVLANAAWQSALDQAVGAERDFVAALSVEPGIPVPVIGIEIGDGIPVSLAWPDLKVAAAAGLSSEDIAELTSVGWSVVGLTLDEVVSALGSKE